MWFWCRRGRAWGVKNQKGQVIHAVRCQHCRCWATDIRALAELAQSQLTDFRLWNQVGMNTARHDGDDHGHSHGEDDNVAVQAALAHVIGDIEPRMPRFPTLLACRCVGYSGIFESPNQWGSLFICSRVLNIDGFQHFWSPGKVLPSCEKQLFGFETLPFFADHGLCLGFRCNPWAFVLQHFAFGFSHSMWDRCGPHAGRRGTIEKVSPAEETNGLAGEQMELCLLPAEGHKRPLDPIKNGRGIYDLCKKLPLTKNVLSFRFSIWDTLMIHDCKWSNTKYVNIYTIYIW